MKNSERRKELKKILDSMPKKFTGQEFANRLRVEFPYSCSDALRQNFLKENCFKESTYSKRWIKKTDQPNVLSVSGLPDDLNEKQAIDLLKQLGYKIFKTEYKEI